MIPVIDMHCDTAGLIVARNTQAAARKTGRKQEGIGYGFSVTEEELENGISLVENKRMISLKGLVEGGYICQSFASYVSEGGARLAGKSPFEYLMEIQDYLDAQLAAHSDLIRPALSGSDIERNAKEGFVSMLRTVEEGLPYEGKLENLKKAYDRGIRKSTLTWNYENELAYPNPGTRDAALEQSEAGIDKVRGLKPMGFEFIHAMEDMGMIIDVSHLNDAGIWDIFRTVKPSTPVIASHSNARGVCFTPRNLSDEMLHAIADHGGVTGINFCSVFLNADNFAAKREGEAVSRVQDMIAHIKYIKKVAGIDVIGLGTDFDGIGGKLEIENCSQIQKLAEAMDRAGFTPDEIEKVFYRNVLRVYKEVLG